MDKENVEYYLVINEFLSFIITCMDLEGFMPSEVSQIKTNNTV